MDEKKLPEGSVFHVSEAYLLPVIALLLDGFPFVIRGFHSDSGSEYVNHKTAELLEKLRIEFTNSRPRPTNDNALAECKNGAVIRRAMGMADSSKCQGEYRCRFFLHRFAKTQQFFRLTLCFQCRWAARTDLA